MSNGSVAAGLAAAGVIGNATGSAVVVSATFVHKTVTAPAMAIAPSAPGAHAQKDAIVEVSLPVIAVGRAGVRRIAVVAVRTNGLNANVDIDLSLSFWRKHQASE